MCSVARKKKSVKLDADILKAFRKQVNKYNTMIDAEEELGISRQIIARVLELGRCNSDTQDKIIKITSQQVA